MNDHGIRLERTGIEPLLLRSISRRVIYLFIHLGVVEIRNFKAAGSAALFGAITN
jgi:hypothetical protein